jgi:hypothetical protein
MNAEQLLNDLGITMGLPGLKFNEEGCARLLFDGRTPVSLEHQADSGQVQIYSELGQLPPEGRETLYLALLEGNLFGLGTQGATLAVDGTNQEVILCRTLIAEEMTSATFSATLESFVTCVEHWRARINGVSQPVRTPEPEDAANPYPLIRP